MEGCLPPRPARARDPFPVENTTSWLFERQSPGRHAFGDARYHGVTPAPAVANVVRRFTRRGDLVVDPMAGSGTTLDVARALGRRALAFDLVPTRSEVHPADARRLPLPEAVADLVFVDPPYGDNVRYSDHPACIGRLSCRDPAFYRALDAVAAETQRILRPGGVAAWVMSDEYRGRRFTPAGFLLFDRLRRRFLPLDIVCLMRRGDRTLTPEWVHRARRRNFLLRGFKYLFLLRKGGPSP